MDKTTALLDVTTYQIALRRAEHDLGHTVSLAKSQGASWADIGRALGITRQAAQQRYAAAKPNTYTCNCGWTHVVRLSPEDCSADTAEILAHIHANHPDAGKKSTPEPSIFSDTDVAGESVTPSIFSDTDVAGESVTPSIFSDAPAPATVPGASVSASGITVFKSKSRQHAATLPRGSKPIRTHAEPGTGKGPHLCTGCGCNDHHGARRGIIEWNDGCRPTKYDTPAETAFLTNLKETSRVVAQ